MSAPPKFFLTTELGTIMPSSTQQTSNFSCPMSTTQAYETQEPNVAKTLSKCKNKLQKPSFVKNILTIAFI